MLTLVWAAAPAASLTALAIDAGEQQTELQISLNGAAQAHSFHLSDPERVVIDLAPAELGEAFSAPPARGLIESVRVAPRGAGVRVVLELARPMAHALYQPEPGGSGAQQWRVRLREAATSAADADSARNPVPAAPRAARGLPAAVQGARDVIVAIDAGHGGADPGASGKAGTREKDITLAIARRLAKLIGAEPGMRAVLTREGDYFVPLRDRMRRARAARADLFISVHADAVRDRSVDGASVYILSDGGASSEAARWLAEQENAADLKGGLSLGDENSALATVLLDLSQSATIGSSAEVAERVLDALDEVGVVRRKLVQQAGFVVLKAPDMPSLLVETAFISNPAEERKLRSATYQQQVAEAILRGARSYFRLHPPDGSRFAAERRSAVAAVRSQR